MKNVVVSGGFDPVHVGHLDLLQNAKKLGGKLTVILNTDSFLKNKKNFIFMPYKERKKILMSFSCVDRVIKSIDKDDSVCKTLKMLSLKDEIDIFANGGDRKSIKDIPEYEICKAYGIKMIFDIGGEKIQSSSNLVSQFKNYLEKRPWGFFENLTEDKEYKVKRLVISPGERISIQFHKHRLEKWIIAKGKSLIQKGNKTFEATQGDSITINPKEVHSLENIGDKYLEVIEVQLGSKLSEEDIIRINDKYGRK